MKKSSTFKKPVNRWLIAVLLAASLTACGDFGDLNVNPNSPSVVKTDLLFTNAQRSVSSTVGDVTGTLYVQYFAETQYDEAARYQSSSFDFNGWYTGALQDLQTIIDLNTNPDTKEDVLSGGSNNNQIAGAKILMAYFYSGMTDRWGMLPYSQALKGRENLRPGYDSQQEIYAGILADLKEAVSLIDGGTGVTGDFILGSDMTKWRQFANSLRMRLAMRLSDVNESLARAEFTDAMNGGYLQEDVFYPYLAEAANQNPWFARFITRTDYAISDVMANYMLDRDDYRVIRYGDPAPNKDNEDGEVSFDEIVGMPYSHPSPGDIENADISFPGAAVRSQNSPLPIITLAEINFMLAEAVERGWIGGSAQSFYETAIEASWRQWDVYDAGNLAAFMAKSDVAYSSANWKERIGYQKWVAMFPNGYEAWSEWRRLDYPTLTPHAFPLNASGQIPLRHAYPSTELQLNEENYKAAVNAQGPDNETVRLWWDVR